MEKIVCEFVSLIRPSDDNQEETLVEFTQINKLLSEGYTVKSVISHTETTSLLQLVVVLNKE